MFSSLLRLRAWPSALVCAAVVLTPSTATAQTAPLQGPAVATGQNTYEDLYARYLEQARSTPAPPSLWMGSLMGDPRAHRVNDLVTIRVVENLSATGTADANVTKTGAAQLSLPTSPVATAIGKVLPLASATKFAGSGGTTRAGTMTATVTGRVIEVLPNGDMVVEGVREIQVNNDRQVVVLTGVVRPADVQPGNVVSSLSVGQLRIQCIGKGLIKDSLTPGWFIRMFNKVF